jgi:hypothetical protein
VTFQAFRGPRSHLGIFDISTRWVDVACNYYLVVNAKYLQFEIASCSFLGPDFRPEVEIFITGGLVL